MKIRKIGWSDPIEQDGVWIRELGRGHPDWETLEEMWFFEKQFLRKIGVKVGKDRATMETSSPEWPGDEPACPTPKRLPPLPPIESSWDGGELLGPQVNHVQHLVRALRHGDSAVDLSSTGVGKTICALITAKNLGLDAFVVCPKAVIPSWERWGKALGVHVRVTNYEQLTRGNNPSVAKHGKKRPAYKSFEWHLGTRWIAILDEAHRCKGRDTLQGLLCSSLRRAKCKTLLLSATLAESPLEMKNTGYALELHGFTNFYDWIPKLGCQKGRFGWFFTGNSTALRMIRDSLIPMKGHRITVEDMKEFFPDNHIIAETFDIDSKINEVYHRMKFELDDLTRKSKRDRTSQLTIMLRAAQEAELLKVPFFIEKAKDLVGEGQSVAIFVQFRETMRSLASSLDCVEIQGDQKGTERQDAIDTFQADKKHTIVCQMQAGGTGISLHQEREGLRPRSTIISPCFDARVFKQVLGRCHRAGAKDRVTQYIAFDANSEVEVRMCESIERKVRNIDTLNDGDLLNELKILTQNEREQ